MTHKNTRRGFTQVIVGDNTLFTSPLEGEDVRRTEEGAWNKSFMAPPLPAFGHPLPQGARITTRGFTLIELLVVVLIIGILSAVAVPQYQKAVKKSRYSVLKSLTRSLETAEEVYFLSHGGYTPDIDALDISFSDTPTSITKTTARGDYFFPWGKCELHTEQRSDHQPRIVCENTNISMAYGAHLLHLNNDTAHAGKHRCIARVSTDTIAHAICKQETGQQNPMDGVDYWY